MTTRPLIFISAVSRELRSARQLVANTLTFLGYEPVWQDIFGTETGDLRQMLREKIDACQGVVQLVGHCYGAEPPAPDEEFGRVSYTQYEALYARKKGKKCWYLFMDRNFPIDEHEAEPAEFTQLQTAYREGLKVDTHLFHPLASREALEAGVLKLRDDLTQLRRGARRWAFGIAALLVVIALMSLWLIRGQEKTIRGMETIAQHFDSIAAGGLIAKPKTPEEHYHNARVRELDGNFAAARQEYAAYLEANLDALDPWLSYAAMLKAQEGRAGAIDTFRALGEKLKPANRFLSDCAGHLRGRRRAHRKAESARDRAPRLRSAAVVAGAGIFRDPARTADPGRSARGEGLAGEIPRRANQWPLREIFSR